MKKLTLILALLLFISCSSDENNSSSNETDIGLVTGINLRDSGSLPIGQLGNPNVFTNNQFTLYPNPPARVLGLLSTEKMTDIWLTPASAKKIYQQTDFSTVLNSNLYAETQIESTAALEFLNLNATRINLNLENLNAGYYKVFVKINGALYWENIFVPDNNFEMDDLINYWK